MENLLLQVLKMSYNGSIVIVFILLIRLFLKKVPKSYSYALWSVVLFRLLSPFSIESAFSLLPIKENPIPSTMTMTTVDTGSRILNDSINPLLTQANEVASTNPIQIYMYIASIVWIIGVVMLLLHSIFSFYYLKKKLENAIYYKDNIYYSDNIETAFVLGIIKPTIYLPSFLDEKEQGHILVHEQMHIKRFDPLIKALSFFTVCIHWFNPLVWFAFFESSNDMEMSCDEMVIKRLGNDTKKAYSSSLLRFVQTKRMFHQTPLAFNEGNTKKRIINILQFKTMKTWISGLLVIVILGVIVSFSFNKKQEPFEQLQFPEMESIAFIQVEHKTSTNTITKRTKIERLITLLKDNKKTSIQSINDAPNVDDYIKIDLYTNNLRTLYLYEKDNKYFMEVPYSGVYTINKDVLSIVNNESFTSGENIVEQRILENNLPEKLFDNKIPYVGDASKVGKLIHLIPSPYGLSYESFELKTDMKPYGLLVAYSSSPEVRSYYSNEQHQHEFKRNALLLFATIENVDMVAFRIVDNHELTNMKFNREDFMTTFNLDAKNSNDIQKIIEDTNK